MSRRKRPKAHPNHERWLVSYADFITLLFAFFVVLYASSQVDQRKVGRLALAIQVAFQELGVFQTSSARVPIDLTEPMPFATAQEVENIKRNANLGRISSKPTGELGSGNGGSNGDLADLQHELETALSNQIAKKEITLRREPDGLVVSLSEVGFFESGSAQMKTTSQPAFDSIAAILKQREYPLRIEGHTDNVPIHNAQFASNWELSTARATELVRLLIVRDGFSPARLSAAGYAEYHPIASNSNMAGRAMNRRVDIIILNPIETEAPVAAKKAESGTSQVQPVRKRSPGVS